MSPARCAPDDQLAPKLARAVLARNGGGKTAKKATTKNKRALKAQAESRIVLHERRGGSKKKHQREKHEDDHRKEMSVAARKILAQSEGGVGIGGHSIARHAEADDDYLRQRVAPGGVRVATTFDSRDGQVAAVCRLLIDHQREIEQWLEGEADHFEVKIERPAEIDVHGFERPHGGGAPVPLTNADLPYVIAPFRRDSAGSFNPWGLITCFPSKD